MPNRAIGYRTEQGNFHVVETNGNKQRPAETQFSYGDIVRLVMIVLTIAHLHDPSPENCNDANLAALCQRCHNIHDMPMRRANAAKTRRAKAAAADLFDARGAA